jgi:hypothetical protein
MKGRNKKENTERTSAEARPKPDKCVFYSED